MSEAKTDSIQRYQMDTNSGGRVTFLEKSDTGNWVQHTPLIAAAPETAKQRDELLKLCKSFITLYNNSPMEPWDECALMCDDMEAVVNEIEAAKAEGRE